MLANLASVVLLGEDTLARGDAAAEFTAALLARDIVLINQSVAAGLGAVELFLLGIGRWMPAEKLECQVLILLALLLCQPLKAFKLHESF